jgi:glycosyltransferase involved in cell wall biosynthesis
VVCHGRLSTSEYEEVVRNSFFLLLPLTFATANNALLEGLSFGVPVICNNVHGVLEYLPSDEYVFNSVDELCAMVEARLNLDDAERNQEATHLANYLETNYSWNSIRDRVIRYSLK